MAWSQMEDVQLTEVPGPDDDDARRPGLGAGERAEPDRGRRRLRAWWPLVAALVLVLAVGPVVAGQRERAREARVAALPGVLAPLSAEIAPLWHRPEGWSQFENLGGHLVLLDRGREGIEIESLVAATGASRWTTVLPEVTPTGDLWCVALDGDSRRGALLACRVVTSSVTEPSTGFVRPAGPVRLVVLDADTGARLAERDLDGAAVALEPFEADLILTQVLADGHAEVTRQDPVTGAVRWTFRSARPVGPAGSEDVWLSPSVQHGVIVVSGPVTWAFAANGTLLGEWHLSGGDRAATGGWWLDVSVLPDGRFAVGESGGVRADDAYGTVSTGAERDGFAIAGPVLVPMVDDGSASSLLLTTALRSGRVRAQDPRTGRVVWESDLTPDNGSILLDGRLIALDQNGLTAVDTRTGAVLWAAPIAVPVRSTPIQTDGRAIIVMTQDVEDGPRLVAYDPADGRQRWSAALPTPLDYLTSVEGTLVAVSQDGLVAFG